LILQKLLDTFIGANDVSQLTKLVNIFDEDFDSEIERIVGDNARADAILSASTAIINERMESNPAYYEKIAVRIQEILDKYKDGRLSEEEKLKHAKDIRSMLMSENNENKNNYPDSIKNNKCAMAFYDNIGLYINEKTNESNHNTELVAEPKAIYGEIKKEKNITENIAIKLNEIFKEVSKKPDWVNNSDVKNQIEGQIEDILWDLEDKYNIQFEDAEAIIGRIRNIGINNYS
jgi:type I restriction enzyme R subunit